MGGLLAASGKLPEPVVAPLLKLAPLPARGSESSWDPPGAATPPAKLQSCLLPAGFRLLAALLAREPCTEARRPGCSPLLLDVATPLLLLVDALVLADVAIDTLVSLSANAGANAFPVGATGTESP